MKPLSAYDVTPDLGFLSPYPMDEVELPEEFDAILGTADMLSGLMTSGRLRTFIDQLPEMDMDAWLPELHDAEIRMLMVRYSFLVQAYVWGEKEAAKVLPRNMAIPYCKLAEKIGQYPLLPYTSYTLDNWCKIDPSEDVSLENISTIQNFFGGVDENWFILVHVEIEAKAGKALAEIPWIIKAINKKDMPRIIEGLKTVKEAWEAINPVFDRMPEQCDPYIYYHRVRPYIHGWKGNPALPDGLIYEGVDKFKGEPQAFRGQTGSQSSIVPSMDAFLGIEHEDDPLKDYLDELHEYRPPAHRAFIEDVRAESKLRDFVTTSANPELTGLYNGVVTAVEAFRTRHLEYAASYIHKQAKDADGNPTDIGTGGTPFMKYLKKHRDESGKHLIK